MLRANRGLALLAAGAGLAVAAREVARRQRAFDLRDRVVLITGGSRGLGLAMAEAFAREGARLVICGRDPLTLELARERLLAQDAEVFAIPCDVSDREQVDDLVERALAAYGRIDVLVNNAGIISVGPLKAQTIADFEDMMGVMFWGTLYPTMAVLPGMRERRAGRVVNVTSIGGKVSVPHLLPYNSAKHAAVGLSEGLRAELAREGIGVVTVVPGLMRTGSYQNAFFKGPNRAEYSIFSVLSNLPGLTMSAERAADAIVRAVKRGDAQITLTAPANLLARFHGLLPGASGDILALVNRALPTAGDDPADTQPRLGRDSETAISRSFLTALGRQAAREWQHGSSEC